MEQGDVVEYWKSAPYLFNFMDSYALKHAFKAASAEREMVRFVPEFPEAFLDLNRARAYQPLEPANPRPRKLLGDTVNRGMWRLLWMPPTMRYYRLAGPFAEPELASVPRLNFEVRHWLVANEALIGCFVCMSFTWSVIEVLSYRVALGLG